jgi:hypothetical protein
MFAGSDDFCVVFGNRSPAWLADCISLITLSHFLQVSVEVSFICYPVHQRRIPGAVGSRASFPVSHYIITMSRVEAAQPKCILLFGHAS